MTEVELSTRFDRLRDYVDATVTVQDPPPMDDDHDLVRSRPLRHVGRHRVLTPLLVAVFVAVVAVSVTLGTRSRANRPTGSIPSTPAAAPVLSCPKTAPTATSSTDLYPLPPAGPHSLRVTGRLVPLTTPVHAVVCAYVHPDFHVLTGSRVVDNGLADIPAALASSPRQTGYQSCTYNLEITDRDLYLIGLSYPSGTLWIAAPDNHCLGSSNGHFTTSTHVATTAIVAYRTGTWVNAAINTNPPGPVRPITSAQDAVSRALSLTAEIVSVSRSRAALTTIAAMISTGYVSAPPPGFAASQQVWAVGIQGVIKPAFGHGQTYDWQILLYDPATGSVLETVAGDGSLPTY